MSDQINEENKSKETKEDLKNKQQMNDELAFNTHAISNATDQFIEKLTRAHSVLQKTLQSFTDSSNQHEHTINQIKLETRILSLLPEKVQNRIDSIIPQIAKEVDLIHSEKSGELTKGFKVLQSKLADDFAEYNKKISDTTEKFASNFKEKVNDLDAAKNRNFLKNTMILVLFSGAVSAVTSYLVATKLPQNVEISGANEVSITNSKVSSYGTNVTIDSKSVDNPEFLRSKLKSQK
jgi:hypothetical protein